jgi:hypothetical protein
MDLVKMAEITANLRTFLLADSSISTAFGTRVYVTKAPDTQTYPFAIIRKVAPTANYMYDGRWGNDDLVQIDVYDDDLAGCVTNAQLIEAELDGYTGAMGSISNTASWITQSPTEEWSPEARHFRSRIDVNIKWTV